MKGESKSGYLIKAVLCGFLIAFNVVLFLNYFTDINITGPSIVWFIAVDIGFIFLIAYPFDINGAIALTIFLLIFGYAAYGPYAEYLRGPMAQISESLSDLPGMAEKQMHCLMLIFTNPMAYQTECVLPEQETALEEKPEQYGLEITNFNMQPEKKIYPGMPFMIRLTLENKGDYQAENVEIETTAGEYEECKISILKDLIPENGTEKLKTSILPETSYLHAVRGIIEDPWTENCTYAKNKAIIGGTITTTYSYDYKTESYLENIEIIKNVNETEPQFEVKSAKEKAAPATILMYTFVPLIWEEAEGYRKAIIPISLNNERKDGTIVFKGKYEYDWLTAIEKDAKVWLSKWTQIGKNTYEYCVNSTNTSQELPNCEKEIEGENITIETENASACLECGGEPVYKWRGKNTRNETEYDKITIKPIGEAADYISLSCNIDGEMSDEGDVASCTCLNNICEIKYTGESSDLKIRPNKEELLYSGLTVSLNGGDWPKPDATKISFLLHADTTYSLELSRSQSLQIKNPHYEK